MNERGRNTAATIGIAIGIFFIVAFVLLAFVAVAGIFFLRSGDGGVAVAPINADFTAGIANGPWVANVTARAIEGPEAEFWLDIGNEGDEAFTTTHISSPVCESVTIVGSGGLLVLPPDSARELFLTCEGLTQPLVAGEQFPIAFEFEPFGKLIYDVTVTN